MESLSSNEVNLILQYIDGALSPENTIAFNTLMNTNEVFASQVKAYENAVFAIKLDRFNTLKNILKSEEERISKTIKTPFKLRQLRGWAVAASVIFLSITGLFLFKKSENIKTEKLLAEINADPMELRWLSISKGNDQNLEEKFNASKYGEPTYQKLREGWGFYISGNYKQAANSFSNLDITNDSFLLVRGMSYDRDGQAAKAIVDLTNIAKNQESKLKEDAEWYLISAYVKNKDWDKAFELCQQIAQTNNHRYTKKAKSLLLKIK